jgi:hypothetical protein
MSSNYNPHNNSHFLLLQDYFPPVNELAQIKILQSYGIDLALRCVSVLTYLWPPDRACPVAVSTDPGSSPALPGRPPLALGPAPLHSGPGPRPYFVTNYYECK